MKLIQIYRGWSIYAVNEDDYEYFGYAFHTYLPGDDPDERDIPEFLADNVQELLDNIDSY